MKPLTLTLILFCALPALAGHDSEKTMRLRQAAELTAIKDALEAARDSLENETAARYSLKQQWVDQREADKQELDRLREVEERSVNDLARVKEECLAKEATLSEERKNAEAAAEEWSYVRSSLSDALKKEADAIAEAFPLDAEQRRAELENIRASFSQRGDPALSWDAFVAYVREDLRRSGSILLVKRDVLLDQGAIHRLTLARFGSVFALGVDTSGQPYMIRQTGRLGAERYSTDRIGSPELTSFVANVMPAWIRDNAVSGTVMAEVLQNDQGRMLVAGKKQSSLQELFASFRAGGLVMIPLLFLPFWALWLTIGKGRQIYSHRRRFARQFKTAMRYLDNNDIPAALSYAHGEKGVMARILETCLERKEHGRHVSERVVRELIMQEVPVVGRGINTLAVIAGAAPLLGLLGTISGMITLFAAVTHYGTGDPKFLAGGISEALITAKTGLAIAIPVLFIHDFVRNGKDRMLSELERLSIAAMNRIWPED